MDDYTYMMSILFFFILTQFDRFFLFVWLQMAVTSDFIIRAEFSFFFIFLIVSIFFPFAMDERILRAEFTVKYVKEKEK